MRVGIHCPYSLSRPGGVQGQVTTLARALRAAGHEAVVIAPGAEPAPALARSLDLEEDALVVVGGAVPVPANGSVAPLALWPGAAARARRAVRCGHFDVVHLHEPLAPGDGYGVLLAGSPPKVGTFHRAGVSAAYRMLRAPARRAAARLAVRVAVSEAAAATARTVLGGEYEIVPNALDLGRFANVRPAAPGERPRGPVLLFVGRHEERKGLAVLLEAFAGEGSVRPVGTLWVAGEGPDTERLRRRYPPDDRVQWLGTLADGELARRFALADVLCAPSLRGESFGVVLLEAMAARTAVVASDLVGYAAVAGGHAILVPPGDTAALRDALVRALADADQGIGTSSPASLDAAAALASRFGSAPQADRYLELYERARRQGTGAPR
jgi:phosphatidyl-myo-inositol alpha-mannosyltransferase